MCIYPICSILVVIACAHIADPEGSPAAVASQRPSKGTLEACQNNFVWPWVEEMAITVKHVTIMGLTLGLIMFYPIFYFMETESLTPFIAIPFP